MNAPHKDELAQYMETVAVELFGPPHDTNNRNGSEWRYGTHGSLAIDLTKGTWYDFENKEGGGVLDLVEREKGLTGKDAFDWLRSIGCNIAEPQTKKPKRELVQTFDYVDADGQLHFQVCRYEPKHHNQRKPNGKGGWDYKVKGVPALPYRLPELLEAIAAHRVIFVVEGERKVDALAKWNFPATCNAGGAKNWKPGHAEYLKGADVIILPDNDDAGRSHANVVGESLQGIAARVRLLELPHLKEKGDVVDWIADGGTAVDFRNLAITTSRDWSLYKVKGEDDGQRRYTGPVFIYEDGCTYWLGKDDAKIMLSNFVATIVKDVRHDDGSGKTRTMFHVETNIGNAAVPSEQFDNLNWVTRDLRSRAIIGDGPHIRGKLLRAIKEKDADNRDVRDVYAHLGWREVNGQWLYLHAAGAIGSNGQVAGANVELENELGHYTLPGETPNLRTAVQASLRTLDMAPRSITWTLLAAVYLAPLAEFTPVTVSLFFAGGSGVRKTAMQTVALGHWYWRNGQSPASWSSTGNSLEALAFRCKDSVLVVDDFCPRGPQTEVLKMHGTAERLLRAQANQGGRQRMNADSTLRATYYPRGLVMASGEDIPSGHSLQARMIVRKINAQDVRLDVLSELQKAAADGLLKQAMAGYVAYVAGQDKSELTAKMHELRADALKRKPGHPRTAENVAELMLGIMNMLDFAVDVGALDDDQAAQELENAWTCLLSVAEEQAAVLKAEQPAERFCSLLAGLLSSGRGHIQTPTGGEPNDAGVLGWRRDTYHDKNGEEWQCYKQQGNAIGWIIDDSVYLDPEPTYAAVKAFAEQQRTTFQLTQHVLWERLHEAGLIERRDQGHYTCRVSLNNQRKRVICISATKVLGIETDEQRKEAEAEGIKYADQMAAAKAGGLG
jgi:hypothetical protein